MTITSAAMMPQPPIHPILGPNALVPHVNVVPQSGMALLSCWYPMAMNIIGTNASSITIGDCSPTRQDHEAERGSQAVGRRHRGDGDHGVGQQPDGPVLEALAVLAVVRGAGDGLR